MTFNEGMQIDTSTTSTSGGGGGGGGGRLAIGGGLGGLLIVVIALFLGVDPGTVLPQGGTGQYDTQGVEAPGFDMSQCKTGKDANDIVDCRIIATGNSVDGVWSQLMKGYTRPKIRLFSQQVNTGCGPATTDVGPFYCPADKTAYFDTSFFQVLVDQFGSSGGPLAQEYVVAHEFGHHVQDLQGTLGRAQQGATGAEGNGVRTELQADCYGGVWAHYAAITKQEGTDVTVPGAVDRQGHRGRALGGVVGRRRPHPAVIDRTGESRVVDPRLVGCAAVLVHQGYRTGDPNKCDTFSAQDLHQG